MKGNTNSSNKNSQEILKFQLQRGKMRFGLNQTREARVTFRAVTRPNIHALENKALQRERQKSDSFFF